eukprot:TRINITY_DN19998_c0_g1_i2.p1 TRINITY_DN19998_c0_g1~~TRINITY_DN19998_c0_g1_i2.p1  ORF type:complete len:240 (+),score=63.82 TRINITY_DN19998_c0_g1_i2:109-720(+)
MLERLLFRRCRSADVPMRVQSDLDNDIWTPSSIKLLIKESRELIPVLRKEYEELLKRKRVRFEDGGLPRETERQTKLRLVREGSLDPSVLAEPHCGQKRVREECSNYEGNSEAAKRARRQARFARDSPPSAGPPGVPTTMSARGEGSGHVGFAGATIPRVYRPAPLQRPATQGRNQMFFSAAGESDADAKRRRMLRFGAPAFR